MWQGYAQISFKARSSGFNSRVVHGGVYFELTHESKKNKICTTTSPKGQCLMEPVLSPIHTWDCLGCP